jgi:hypothetical protein
MQGVGSFGRATESTQEGGMMENELTKGDRVPVVNMQ